MEKEEKVVTEGGGKEGETGGKKGNVKKGMHFGAQRINIVFLLIVYIHIYIDAYICIHGIFNFSNRFAITRLYTRRRIICTRKIDERATCFETCTSNTSTSLHTHTHTYTHVHTGTRETRTPA